MAATPWPSHLSPSWAANTLTRRTLCPLTVWPRLAALTLRLHLRLQIVIMIFIAVAMSSGIFVLLKTSVQRDAPEDSHYACPVFRGSSGRFEDWLHIFFTLANSALEGESEGDCLIETSPTHWILAWAYGFTFFVLSVVLLLNML